MSLSPFRDLSYPGCRVSGVILRGTTGIQNNILIHEVVSRYTSSGLFTPTARTCGYGAVVNLHRIRYQTRFWYLESIFTTADVIREELKFTNINITQELHHKVMHDDLALQSTTPLCYSTLERPHLAQLLPSTDKVTPRKRSTKWCREGSRWPHSTYASESPAQIRTPRKRSKYAEVFGGWVGGVVRERSRWTHSSTYANKVTPRNRSTKWCREISLASYSTYASESPAQISDTEESVEMVQRGSRWPLSTYASESPAQIGDTEESVD
ncbi:hypothetical protein J6590_023537 [Homalodisca vitripennis]|nr:hypothetical protein J6590_023537 [Homalodisca vitripennis]